jgi:chloride channel protein, CIC family
MMTCASAYLLSRSFTVNSEQVSSIADSPAHRGEFLVNVLEDLTVGDAILMGAPPEVMREETSFTDVLRKIRASSRTVFPVVNENGYLVGIFSLSDIRQIMSEPSLGSLVLAGELGTRDVVTVTSRTNLNDALRKLTQIDASELPVIEYDLSAETGKPDDRRRKVVAMLSRKDLIAAYQRRIGDIQSEDKERDNAVLKPH